MISAVVITKNEEKNIERCLKNLLWCDEIIVIDDCSKDNTVEIAKKLGAKIYKRYLNNDFAGQRNFGLSKAKNEWVLFVDADEIVSEKLKREIQDKTKGSFGFAQDDRIGFYMKRRDFFVGKEMKHGEVGNIKLLRLARKNRGKWKRKVHEYWEVNGKTGELKYPILHYPHPTIREFIEDINDYSAIHAEELQKEGKDSNIYKIIIWPIGKFFVNYFLKLGILDGAEGFIIASLMSFHSFLAWSKLWMD